MNSSDKNSKVESAIRGIVNPFAILGRNIILEAKADDRGQIALNAPTIPTEQVCVMLATLVFNLIFQEIRKLKKDKDGGNITLPFGR